MHDESVDYKEELERILPADLPYRCSVIEKAAEHLRLIDVANEHMNLTRITSPREAAIKHVFDSVAPWHHFLGARNVLDAGTGAGFPGVPLSVVLPEVKFTLAESIQKKARFLDSAVETIGLANVRVIAGRAEAFAASRKPEVITARAVAPMGRLLDLFGAAVKKGAALLLYKGPDVEAELDEARNHRLHAEVVCRYELPDSLGTRSVVKISATTS